jgi:hypothetical protein
MHDLPSPDYIKVLVDRAKAGELTEAEAPAAYAAIGALRDLADRYERDLIRSLRWDRAGNVLRTWAQVADVVQAQLGSRQAAHARWGRLKSPARGSVPKGRPRSRPADGVPS